MVRTLLVTRPCDLDHIPDVSRSDKLYVMARKIISALLLIAMAVWAELTLAPLLSLHVHAEMAAQAHLDHQPADMPAHPCCPQTHGAVAPPYAISSAELPCADEHRCCFRQGPQSAPAPAGSPNRLSRELVVVNWLIASENPVQIDIYRFNTSAELRSPPGDFNMVLRT